MGVMVYMDCTLNKSHKRYSYSTMLNFAHSQPAPPSSPETLLSCLSTNSCDNPMSNFSHRLLGFEF
jgi:hypothetical protein